MNHMLFTLELLIHISDPIGHESISAQRILPIKCSKRWVQEVRFTTIETGVEATFLNTFEEHFINTE